MLAHGVHTASLHKKAFCAQRLYRRQAPEEHRILPATPRRNIKPRSQSHNSDDNITRCLTGNTSQNLTTPSPSTPVVPGHSVVDSSSLPEGGKGNMQKSQEAVRALWPMAPLLYTTYIVPSSSLTAEEKRRRIHERISSTVSGVSECGSLTTQSHHTQRL